MRPSKRLFIKIAPAIIFALTLFVYLPISIYHANMGQLKFTLLDALPILVCSTVASTLLLAIGCTFSPIVRTLLLALAALMLIQSNFLDWNYGPLDGRSIIWEDYVHNGIIDTTIWLTIIALSIYFHDRISRLLGKAGGPLVLFLMTMSLFHGYEAVQFDDLNKSQYNWNSYSIGDLSKNDNTLVFLFDEMQSNLTQEVLDESPELKEIFEGFVHYTNAISTFNSTIPSITEILSGRHYDNSIPLREFQRDVYLDHSLPKRLKERGFGVDLYTGSYPIVYLHPELADNVYATRSSDQHLAVAKLSEAVLFLVSPHWTKRWLYHEGTWSFTAIAENSKDTKRARNMPIDYPYEFKQVTAEDRKNIPMPDYDPIQMLHIRKNLKAVSTSPRFKFFYMTGSHSPHNIDENGNTTTLEPLRLAVKQKIKYKLKIFSEVLNDLKAKSLYDISTIVVLSDHGCGRNDDTEAIYTVADDGQPIANIMPLKGRANPVFMVKKKDERHKLSITEDPVSYSNMADILFNLATHEADLKLASNSPRFHTYYAWNPKSVYLDAYTEFIVNGPIWLDSSWLLYHQHLEGEDAGQCILNLASDFKVLTHQKTKLNNLEFTGQLPEGYTGLFGVVGVNPKLAEEKPLMTIMVNDKKIEATSNLASPSAAGSLKQFDQKANYTFTSIVTQPRYNISLSLPNNSKANSIILLAFKKKA